MFHPFKIQENGRKRIKSKLVRFVRKRMLKFNPELPCIRVNNSKSSFSLMTRNFFPSRPGPLACTRRLFIFQRDSPPRNHADFRNYHILASAHASLSLSLCPTDAIMKRAPPILPSPSPVPPFAAQFAREKPASIARDVPALKYFRTCAVKENKNE